MWTFPIAFCRFAVLIAHIDAPFSKNSSGDKVNTKIDSNKVAHMLFYRQVLGIQKFHLFHFTEFHCFIKCIWKFELYQTDWILAMAKGMAAWWKSLLDKHSLNNTFLSFVSSLLVFLLSWLKGMGWLENLLGNMCWHMMGWQIVSIRMAKCAFSHPCEKRVVSIGKTHKLQKCSQLHTFFPAHNISTHMRTTISLTKWMVRPWII